jgi:hypothetical protein
LETIIRLEPPHVGCYFFNGLLGQSPDTALLSGEFRKAGEDGRRVAANQAVQEYAIMRD